MTKVEQDISDVRDQLDKCSVQTHDDGDKDLLFRLVLVLLLKNSLQSIGLHVEGPRI